VTVLNESRRRLLDLRGRAGACIHCSVSLIRLFTVGTAVATVLIVVLVAASLLELGGAVFEDGLHNLAEVAAGLFAAGVACIAALRSRGRRRTSWFCWSAYALLEGLSDWNVLAAHTPIFFPSWSDAAIFAQVPLVLVAAVAFMRVVSPRLAVTVAYCDGLLMGGGVLLIGMATGYDSFLNGRTSVLVSMITLAQPVADVVVLTLMAAVVARVGRKTRPVGLLLGAAIVSIGISDAELARHVGLGITAPGSVFVNGWIAGLLCLGIAALYSVCFRRRAESSLAGTARSRAVLLVPVLPVALAGGIGVR
jgi:diguanylate cyclase